MVLVYNTGMSAIAELNINLVSANDALFLTSMILRFAQSLWTRRYFYRALFALGVIGRSSRIPIYPQTSRRGGAQYFSCAYGSGFCVGYLVRH